MDENTAKQLVINLSKINGFQASAHSPGYYLTLPNGSWVSMRSCKHKGDWMVIVAWVYKITSSLGHNSFGANKEFYTPAGIQELIDARIGTLTT